MIRVGLLSKGLFTGTLKTSERQSEGRINYIQYGNMFLGKSSGKCLQEKLLMLIQRAQEDKRELKLFWYSNH